MRLVGWIPFVQYALIRYLAQENGWEVKGIDATWFHENFSPSTVLKSLAVFVATVTDLIHAEPDAELKDSHVKEMPTSGLVSLQSHYHDRCGYL